MTKFIKNVNKLIEIEHSLFFMNFGYESRMKFNTIKIFNLQSTQKRIYSDRIQTILR